MLPFGNHIVSSFPQMMKKMRDNCSGRCAQLLVLLLAAFAVAVIWEGCTVLGSPASHFSNIADWNKNAAHILFSDFLLRNTLFIPKWLLL